MTKDLYRRDDIDRIYMLRKRMGRRLDSIKDSIDTSTRVLEDYIKTAE